MTPTTRLSLAADDWTAFRRIRLRALADAPDAFGATVAQAAAQPDETWQERAAGPGRILLALEDGEPLAMGGAYAPEGAHEAMIWGMWTAPEARGRGHAQRILAELVAWCRERGLDVLLHVTDGNDAARRLYRRHGFEPVGEWSPLRPGSDLRVETLRLAR
ncbi:GNAT family N-acetyltransferase [Nocardioides sp. GCM10027113]|uniref:GNAT family N-acetyltransferase n=1 Tax=unclassified Nocardioides TaxID=2615069 RepID=UPI00360B25E0